MTEGFASSFEYSDTQSLLTAARTALGAGQARLAIHLYCAAFEMGSNQGSETGADVDQELISGLRVALNLALEMGDRATSETLLSELEPFDTPDQYASDLLRLQRLAAPAIDALVIEPEAADKSQSAEGIAQILTEATEGIDFNQWIKSFRSALGLNSDEGSDKPDSPSALLALPPGMQGLARNPEDPPGLIRLPNRPGDLASRRHEEPERDMWRLDYNHIIGYRQALEQMRSFGFFRRDEAELHRFADRVAHLHGVHRLSLTQPFLFSGPDFNDVGIFAHATANEIGWPLLSIRVEIDERGNGTIKISGPFKHRFFGGPPDLTELNTPCTVLLEDIGALQKIFLSEQRSFSRDGSGPAGPGFGGPGFGGPGGFGGPSAGPGSWDPAYRRNVRMELGGYLHDLVNKPGVFFMATSRADFVLDDMILDIVGPMHEVHVDHPLADERRTIWEHLKLEHSSLKGLDTEELVDFSTDTPRTLLFAVTQEAVDSAYRASLSSGQYQAVKMGDILTGLGSYMDPDSSTYQRLEDAVVVEFLQDLEENSQ